MMKVLSKYRPAILILAVMVFHILLINGFLIGQEAYQVGLYKSIDKVLNDGPYHLEGGGTLILIDANMAKLSNELSIHFEIDGHLDFKNKNHGLQISLKDAFGYEKVPLGRYRGLGNTHLIQSEVGGRETMDISAFIHQMTSNEVTINQIWESVQNEIEVNRSWIKDNQKSYNPIKREVVTYALDLGSILTQTMIEEMSHLLATSFMVEEAQISYHTDQKGNPIALEFDIKTQQVHLKMSISINKTI
ncbi:hypothetical protein [Petrocella sp. FN5]|uniref:hypothetical protein n=1 Tax=Petrocella sp. FN5 TaxID=3032002 RepID=UPI0023DA35C1|nr:hypothetical protein [Petrocella sp. FN5]MDF1617099.1 hypothetical protein [Petrocella sp. FN5]